MADQTDPTDPIESTDGAPEHDPAHGVLAAAGARLRGRTKGVLPAAVEARVLRRRSQRLGVATAVLAVALVVTGGVALGQRGDHAHRLAAGAGVDEILASLDPKPIDPTTVKLVSTVRTFPDCSALIDDLRKVGAAHVGSRGFGDSYGQFMPVGRAMYKAEATSASDATAAAPGQTNLAYTDGAAASGEGATLGTNVQIAGVDELDSVKAEGNLIYDLDGKGNFRITDASTLQVLAKLDVTPALAKDSPDSNAVTELLVEKGRAAIFGTESETSKPVPGDPSATQSTLQYLTVTMVDATNPAKPTVTDRVRIEGSLVSARMVNGQVRLVTTSNMSDLGFVMPTTPNSVAKALDENRRSVAGSKAADWIPDWWRTDEPAHPLVPCERVHVPDTFAGVAMTSMVSFPIGTGRFEPEATAIVAPGTTLYAGLDTVAVSSEVWVDPADRDRLRFDDWQTAIHEFRFSGDDAPDYEGSGIVDGSTVGQFAFGELGDNLAVVTTQGTPWRQESDNRVDLDVLHADGKGTLARVAQVTDLAQGRGAVSAVRFLDGRVLVSTGFDGRAVHVIDVSDPAKPRRAGSLSLPIDVGYFHPLPEHQALIVGQRVDNVGAGRDERMRSWVQADLLDVADPDQPRIVGTWEQPWTGDDVGGDHHAFTYWPQRKLAMWGIRDTSWMGYETGEQPPNHALVLSSGGNALAQVALPVAEKPNEEPPPCPVVPLPSNDPDLRNVVGADGVILQCGDPSLQDLDWARYDCSKVDDDTVRQYAPDQAGKGAIFLCHPAGQPTVARVLVVGGKPILYTDQTLQVLDPNSFATTAIAFHPTRRGFGPIVY